MSLPIQPVLQYKCSDGSAHTSYQAVAQRESLIQQCSLAMLELHLPPGIADAISAGKGWYRHELKDVLQARENLLRICRALGLGKTYEIFNKPAEEVHPHSLAGRILSERYDPLSKAWDRLGRIDAKGREHQQPYFAYFGDVEAHHVQLNP